MTELQFYRIHKDVMLPTFQTQGAAAFDIHAYLPEYKEGVLLRPNRRVVIPTGLIFDIPHGYHVKLYARSGLAYKFGLTLTNSVGIIDSDYVDEVKIMLSRTGNNHHILDPSLDHREDNTNLAEGSYLIRNGDRIAQGMLVKNVEYVAMETDVRPTQKTDRTGGFGSTGS